MIYILSLLIGFLSAFIGSIVGFGGGILLVPILLLLSEISPVFSWATPQSIVGLSLVVMVFTALSSTLSYIKKKRVDYKSGFIFLSGALPGGIVGSWLNQYIQSNVFSLYFGVIVLLISFLFFLKKQEKLANPTVLSGMQRNVMIDGKEHFYSYSVTGAVILTFAVGVLSGLFGIGGGSLMVPAMILMFGFPPHIATATSMFMIFFLSTISSITHITLGNVLWEYVVFFIPGAWIGGTIGAKVNQRLKGNTVEWFLRILLIVIGIRLIWQGLG
ncbi:sulfite exporter TauE/SafE family protein [Aquibacillus sp. 3ASR75-11]|uniref:Probable membrane transporter protein n=1 Tax=Terrihalobacillus insolitus TaxID=2950438 RepID=A0A9X3WNJ9_9BACI|nr:sulfite exporter TauE/SafE family protein [Terrihalobacillus insolitus]MDC3412347.1 sulfite exporter TauE/SafE family protein [Terrihalobacillus insolitus]MDC3422960.1 sulfite exporter TauE/SafE family protein [Terrihalobacillus insolitus]